MREILFRGKRVDNGEWETGSLVISRMGTSESKFYIADKMTAYHTPVIPETVGQYTGLTDKNGKKIFEGDVIECDIFFKKEKLVVKYYAGAFSFSDGKEIIPFNDSEYGIVNVDGVIDGVLIGNIHDNPELGGEVQALA